MVHTRQHVTVPDPKAEVRAAPHQRTHLGHITNFVESPAPTLECPVEAPEESGLLVRRMALEDQGYLHLGQAQGTQLAPVLGSKVDLDPPGRVLDKD